MTPVDVPTEGDSDLGLDADGTEDGTVAEPTENAAGDIVQDLTGGALTGSAGEGLGGGDTGSGGGSVDDGPEGNETAQGTS